MQARNCSRGALSPRPLAPFDMTIAQRFNAGVSAIAQSVSPAQGRKEQPIGFHEPSMLLPSPGGTCFRFHEEPNVKTLGYFQQNNCSPRRGGYRPSGGYAPSATNACVR